MKTVVKKIGKKVERSFRRALLLLPANARTIIKGMVSYIPHVYDFADDTRSISAEFCYSVWMRHLVIAAENGLPTDPKVFVELGPGSTIGVGLCAMLCGADKHYALDALSLADGQRNLKMFEDLIKLFQKRADIPHGSDFQTMVKPPLNSYGFPDHVLTSDRLERTLSDERISAIRGAISRAFSNTRDAMERQIDIFYVAPWRDPGVVPRESADMVLSNTVLQSVEDISRTYDACRQWLKVGGYMSHNIDYSSYGNTKEWNGHWGCSDLEWRLMKGKRAFLLNRIPHSGHIQIIRDKGFKIVYEMTFENKEGIGRKDLAPLFRRMSDEDLHTEGALIQAIKI